MFCPKCARENPDVNKFCHGCGGSLIVEVIPPTRFIPPPPPPPFKIESVEIEKPLDRPEPVLTHEATKEDQINVAASSEGNWTLTDSIQTLDESTAHEDLSRVFEDAELLLDDLFPDAKHETSPMEPAAPRNEVVEVREYVEQHETPSRSPSDYFVDNETNDESLSQHKSEPDLTELVIARNDDTETGEIFEPPQTSIDSPQHYFTEIEKKYGRSVNEEQPAVKKDSRISIGVAAVAGMAILAAIIGVGWYLTESPRPSVLERVSETNAMKTTPDNKKSPVANPPDSIGQPPDGMAYVPNGTFMMGSDSDYEYSRPAHKVSVKAFYIDRTEVTCDEYKKFLDATGHTAPPTWTNGGFPSGTAQEPVVGVNWDDATAFAKWNNKRLPTEEEWEYAARGTDGRLYPWGNSWQPDMANADGQKSGVQPVGSSSGQSPFGLFDMSGNAWEWTSSRAKAYPQGKAFPRSSSAKILRGGSWESPANGATTIYRIQWGAHGEDDYSKSSFRCAKDIAKN